MQVHRPLHCNNQPLCINVTLQMHSLFPVRKPNHGHVEWKDEHHRETQSAETKLIRSQNPLGQALMKS